MRLWSIHPKYLDAKALVALWREALLAQKVLEGRTKGYRQHPQLNRFRSAKAPLQCLGSYLLYIAIEAERRGYRFDRSKILFQRANKRPILLVTRGQLKFETKHLLSKLKIRDPLSFHKLVNKKSIQSHPVFRAVAGPIADWERASKISM